MPSQRDRRYRRAETVHRFSLAILFFVALPGFAQEVPSSFTARGNEPGWMIEISATTLSLTPMGEKGEERYPLPSEEVTGTGRRFVVADGPTVTVSEAICRDDATGMPHVSLVTVDIDGSTLQGCGGDPATLLPRNAWRITEVDAAAFPADVPLWGPALNRNRRWKRRC